MRLLIGTYAAATFLNAAIGLFVLVKKRRDAASRSLFLMSLGIAGWIAGLGFMLDGGDGFWIRWVLLSGILAVAGLTALSYVFPTRSNRFPMVAWVPLAVIAAVPAAWFIRGFLLDGHGFLKPLNGPAFPIFAIVLTTYVGLDLSRLASAFRESSGVQKVRLRYFLWGTGIFLSGAVVCDVLLPAFGWYAANFVGPLSSVAFMGFTAYAIVQHQFMDIRVVVKRSATYAAAIVSLAIMFFGIEFLVEKFWSNDEIVDILAAIVGGLSFPYVKDFFERVTDKVFFRAHYDYPAAIDRLNVILGSTIELSHLMNEIQEFLAATVKPKTTLVFLENRSRIFQSDPDGGIAQEEARDIFETWKDFGCPHFYVQDVGRFSGDNERSLRWRISSAGFAGIVPLRANGRVIGVLLLGEKRSDDIFRSDDKSLLSVMEYQGGMALENALLYETIKRHNEELEDLVADRIKEIRLMYRTQERFVTDISHELQTPIAIMQGNIEIAAQRAATPEDRAPLKVIKSTLEGMAHLVSEFLQVAQLNFSKNRFNEEPFDLGILVKEVHEDCMVLAETKDMSFELDADEQPVPIQGDRKKLKEVVLNLLSNALKFTDRGGRIVFRLRQSGGDAVFQVEDSGIGIAPEDLAHIFERFYRIPGTETKGTGLGLNICREIIEWHGGTIAASSRRGEGSVFTVRLPLVQTASEPASAIL
ncbi:MAG TPA: ATP-binding protein [Candidatus Paceibacterota bacterium]|nr:ATP-binding protein [Candidatus Paceibacterota bacterium]